MCQTVIVLRYGCNPHQLPARIYSKEGTLPFNVLNGSPGYINMLERTPVEGYIGTCCAIRDADMREATASIDRPTLVLCGDRDLATPPELAAKLADAIPDAIFSLVEDAAHISCVEQPEIFSRSLIKFLEENSSA